MLTTTLCDIAHKPQETGRGSGIIQLHRYHMFVNSAFPLFDSTAVGYTNLWQRTERDANIFAVKSICTPVNATVSWEVIALKLRNIAS